MLGSAVSSSTPTDFHPRSTMGFSEFPLMNCQALTPGPTQGCPYIAVGMHKALDSAIGLSNMSTNASCMLLLLMPADVSRNFIIYSTPRLCVRLTFNSLDFSNAVADVYWDSLGWYKSQTDPILLLVLLRPFIVRVCSCML